MEKNGLTEFDKYIEAQVEKQYGNKRENSLKRKIDLEQFSSEIHKMSDKRYAEIESLISEATINDIIELYLSKKLSSKELVVYYLKRIAIYDVDKLNSIMELNPDAINIAEEKDANMDFTKGKLQGIPIILKDNIATGDRMHNTAGAYALKDSFSKEDSFIARKLKEAGAIILAKANMSEWANFISGNSANGYSVLGGQTHNPYGSFDVGGSSSGSAVAVACNFSPVAIGTETCGSIVYPASQNSVIGLKPSMGLISRDRIIPIVEAQDTAGVITRNMEDLERVFEVICGYDEKDEITKVAKQYKENSEDFFKDCNFKGMKIAVINLTWFRTEEQEIYSRVKRELEEMGAVIQEISLCSKEIQADLNKIDMNTVLTCGFKVDVKKYLQTINSTDITCLEDVMNFNKIDLKNRAPFGQDLIEESIGKGDISKERFDEIVEINRQVASGFIDEILEDTEVILSLSNNISHIYSAAGYPALNVPAGYKSSGEPIGITFVAAKLQDRKLMSIAREYMKNTKHRKQLN